MEILWWNFCFTYRHCQRLDMAVHHTDEGKTNLFCQPCFPYAHLKPNMSPTSLLCNVCSFFFLGNLGDSEYARMPRLENCCIHFELYPFLVRNFHGVQSDFTKLISHLPSSRHQKPINHNIYTFLTRGWKKKKKNLL